MRASSKQQAASSAVASRPQRRGGLYTPQPIGVRCGEDGLPELVGGVRVESIRDEWLVEDRWWSTEPLRRRYLELVLASGRCTVVFCDLETARWFEQR